MPQFGSIEGLAPPPQLYPELEHWFSQVVAQLLRTHTTVDGVVTSPESIFGWSHNLVFTATDNDTVAWEAGTIVLASGTSYSINAGNTGAMADPTFIYLDTSVSLIALQTTTTHTDAVGAGRILVAAAQDVADATKLAEFQVFGAPHSGKLILTEHIAADAVTANEIAANTITANEVASMNLTTQSLTATVGAVGGWSLGATSLTSGSGATRVGLDSGGANPAIYAGSETPGSAPFRVTGAGAMTATSGSIAGWTINSTTLSRGSGASTVGMTTSGSVAFFAGNATPASAPFRVSTDGSLVATNATITGTLAAGSVVESDEFTATNPVFDGSVTIQAGTGASRHVFDIDSNGGRFLLYDETATRRAVFRIDSSQRLVIDTQTDGGAMGIISTGGLELESSVISLEGLATVTGSGSSKFVVSPGSDADCTLIQVQVTDAPLLTWDETDDSFVFSKMLTISESQDELLRLNHQSVTGSPYISWRQNGTQRAWIKYADAGDSLQITSDFGPVLVSSQAGIVGVFGQSSHQAFGLPDGITAPATATGIAWIYVDTADGDLKVKFGDGTVKTLATDT